MSESEAGDSASEVSRKSEENDGPPAAPTLRSGIPQDFKNPVTFRECFKAFSKFGDTKSDGKFVTLTQSDKWMKQAKIIDSKKVTTTDTGIFFKKFKQKKLNLTDYEKFLADICKSKNLNIDEVKRQMGSCGAPEITSNAAGKVPNAFERLTDTSKYTGSHKLRFDESGKGKGIQGRKDLPDSSGDEYINENDDILENAYGLLRHIIRDPPCRLSFPRGCTFVVIESPKVKHKFDQENESYCIDVKVDIAEETNEIMRNSNFNNNNLKNSSDVDDIISSIEDKIDEYDEALEYDDEADEEDDACESVEEEEDWTNFEKDSDDCYSS